MGFENINFNKIYKENTPINNIFNNLENQLSIIDKCFYELFEKYAFPGEVTTLKEATLSDKIKYEINNVKENIDLIIERLQSSKYSKNQIKACNINLGKMYGHIENIEKGQKYFIDNNDPTPQALYNKLNNLLQKMWAKIKEYNSKYENKLFTGKQAQQWWIKHSMKNRDSLIKTWTQNIDKEKK